MPYITDTQRAWVAPYLRPLMEALTLDAPGAAAGVLNFVITKTVLAWLGENPNYERFNSALGVLEAVKLEMYRRVVAPYEDHKRAVNGDVFPFPPDYTKPGPFADPVLVPAQVPGQTRCTLAGCEILDSHAHPMQISGLTPGGSCRRP